MKIRNVWVLPILLLLLGLGFWQVERLAWKTELIKTIESQQQAIPVGDLSQSNLEHRKAVLFGQWLDVPTFRLMPRTHDGRMGVHLLQPFRLTDGTVLLVNRGWVAMNSENTPQQGPALLEGVLRTPQAAGWMTPDNNAETNEWFWVDFEAMGQKLQMNLAPYVLEQTSSDYKHSNNHRGYAITWFVLAGIIGVMWVILNRKEKA